MLDFSKPFDVALLDQVVTAFQSGTEVRCSAPTSTHAVTGRDARRHARRRRWLSYEEPDPNKVHIEAMRDACRAVSRDADAPEVDAVLAQPLNRLVRAGGRARWYCSAPA